VVEVAVDNVAGAGLAAILLRLVYSYLLLEITFYALLIDELSPFMATAG
jgi:hypothetical protein